VTSDPAPSVPSPYNVANAVTVLRMLLVPVFGVFLFAEGGDDRGMRVAACAVFVIATLTDKLDGDLARRRGIVTSFGQIADPIADKALIGVALVGLSVLGELAWWVTIAILVREVGVTVLRFVVLRQGVIPASHGGKIKTVVQMLAVVLYLLFPDGAMHTVAQVTMGLALVITVVTGVEYVLVAVRMRRRSGAESTPTS
jgi:CDP-diacylglycerol--glycerol-3-phosphate 3-phosphatidyltransferase